MLRNGGISKKEWLWAGCIALAVLTLSSIPPGYRLSGLTYNVTDVYVYLSWMRQAADGHFFLRNLFTTEPQVGHGFNLFFFALGTIARITHLPLLTVFHLARITFGTALLMAVYGFTSFWLKDPRSRRIALLVVGLSSGLGWIFRGLKDMDAPVDTWQPEAITFLSVHCNPLFAFSLLLMVGSVHLLYRYTFTREWRYAVGAGILIMILANVHTYDLIALAIGWASFSAYRMCRRDFRPLIGGLTAAAVAAPLVAYQAYFYMTEPVFQARAAVPTLSPNFTRYLLGYGFLIPLGLLGVYCSVRERRDTSLLVFWALAGLIAAYLPVQFQRKLIMGTHIPLSILATLGMLYLGRTVPKKLRLDLPVMLLALTIPSNLLFLWRDFAAARHSPPSIVSPAPRVLPSQNEFFAFVRRNTDREDVILVPPWLGLAIPAHTGRRVYCAHWAETIDYVAKAEESLAFYASMTDQDRIEFLRQRRIRYVVECPWHAGEEAILSDFEAEKPYFLKLVFAQEKLRLYRVLNAPGG